MVRTILVTFTVMCLPLLVTSCTHQKSIKKLTICHRTIASQAIPKHADPPITIWVHGTRFIRRPIFYNFFKSTPSLRLAKELANDYYLHNVARILCKSDPDQFCMDTFYLFGWSGKLSTSERELSSQALYHEIKQLVADYKRVYHRQPFIRIITHSHGGTVALHMAKMRGNDLPFTIDELILLACPVQEDSQCCIDDPLFKQTLSLYSTLDMVQIIAPQIVYNVFRTRHGHQKSRMVWPPFSKRRFNEKPRLTQVKLKINGRALFHTEFTNQRFARILPHIIHVIKSWQQQTAHGSHLLCIYTEDETAIPVPLC
jgi:hypothetical protein